MITANLFRKTRKALIGAVVALGAVAGGQTAAQADNWSGGFFIGFGNGHVDRGQIEQPRYGHNGPIRAHHPGRGWVELDTNRVGRTPDREVFRAPGRERFSQIRVCVYRAPVFIDRLRVIFANDGRQNIDVRPRFQPGTCSRAIDLRGRRDRDIRRVVLRAEAVRRGGPRPLVAVFAR